MERIFSKDFTFSRAFLPALVLAAVACSMVVILYGVDTIIPMVHDTFHDFRHVLGMPCH
ncbi:MAG: CbtB-domain containing protein [Deltaproteobacteria bacterium]|nr:CbtB-domain containing protein [Deltaproteobacteria bacterium]